MTDDRQADRLDADVVVLRPREENEVLKYLQRVST
jgi:hypothetical protein